LNRGNERLTKNVSPTIQLGAPLTLGINTVLSKMAPRHIDLFWGLYCPRFISWELMGQSIPPKESEMLTAVVHAA